MKREVYAIIRVSGATVRRFDLMVTCHNAGVFKKHTYPSSLPNTYPVFTNVVVTYAPYHP